MNNNYTYIIASIPALSPDSRFEGGSVMPLIGWIGSQLSDSDLKKLEFVCSGFKADNLDMDFYLKAFKSKDGFTREFFAHDLALRNAKVRYLNRELGRDKDKDVMALENAPEVDSAALDKIFGTDNLLERERAMDDYLWATADNITLFKDFELAKVLAIVAKLCIIERWLALDENTGRELLATLVSGIRGTYGKIEFENYR